MKALYDRCGGMLLEDVIPFWLRHAPDPEHGGFLHHLDREGGVFSTDKGVWIQCRAVWMFSKLYNTVERRAEWLQAAASGWDFINKHAYDMDGRRFFLLTRSGGPLRKRRYVFSEAFCAVAGAEYARASGDENAMQRARAAFGTLLRHYENPLVSEAKFRPETRPMRPLAMPMILLATSLEMTGNDDDPIYQVTAERCAGEILRFFFKPEIPALLEYVSSGGGLIDAPVGRLVNPGHALETACFILREAERGGNDSLSRAACDIIDWTLEAGWDEKHGGLFAFIDAGGFPCEQLEWDMKLWWPHAEAMCALLQAARMTGIERYNMWLEKVSEYAMSHFPDPEHGEWFGYLHRDGSVANSMKGGLWKGPFHVPRALLMLSTASDEARNFRAAGGRNKQRIGGAGSRF